MCFYEVWGSFSILKLLPLCISLCIFYAELCWILRLSVCRFSFYGLSRFLQGSGLIDFLFSLLLLLHWTVLHIFSSILNLLTVYWLVYILYWGRVGVLYIFPLYLLPTVCCAELPMLYLSFLSLKVQSKNFICFLFVLFWRGLLCWWEMMIRLLA